MRDRLPTIIAPLLLTLSLVYLSPLPVFATVSHLVISEVQIGDTTDTDNEFIELFNPSDSTISLDHLRLQVNTSNLVASLSGSLLPHHYYLVAKPAFTTIPVTPDVLYSASSSSITANSYITLFDTDHTTILDRLGMGTSTLFETQAAATPSSTQNLHRTDVCNDSDNNSSDFHLAPASPQNSTSAFSCTTPSPTPTSTPTPSPSPTPTDTLTPTPTETSTPSPTLSPTPTETITPTLPPSPTLTPTPTLSPVPTPPPGHVFANPFFTCTLTYKPVRVWWHLFFLPQITCTSHHQV